MPIHYSPEKVRDHLANERTHLAWVRTSIALLGFGVVVARLPFVVGVRQPGPDTGIPAEGHGGRALLLGLLFCAVGVIALGLSASVYVRNRKAIESGAFVPAGLSLLVLTAIIAVLGVASVLFLLRL